ncbi:MAG: carboxypeptidase regulatory-like domain-containing protein [Anaerolineae bacterium]|nr:carboxypeptidase regulatory-like domain-containing protein [Anaerolineae bacterium]
MVKPKLLKSGMTLGAVLLVLSASGLVRAISKPTQNHEPVADYTLAGVVRDYDNTTLANAGVFYFGTNANIGSTSTDANGLFTFTLSADTYELSTSKSGYPAPVRQTITLPPDRINVVFTYPQRYTITGFVRDALGAPIADALVAGFGTDLFSTSERTDVIGAYTLTVKADTYSVTASKSGFPSPQGQSVSVPPSRSEVNFTLGEATVTLTPTSSPSPTATQTRTPTPQSTPALPVTRTIFLPVTIRQVFSPTLTATPTPTPTPTRQTTPTKTSTPTSGNRAPVFPQPLPITASTENQLDENGRLTGAVTTIKISSATDADGDTLTYAWSASSGSIIEVSTDGLTGKWSRVISAGRIQPGTVTIVVSDGRGGTANATLNFR